ncbi:MAG: hydantoinase B/oxoprolinase family protein [Candidatus Rokubacteria bacterium]|nr:hydantoinase B/oxoprolinase family protein [Candidatus Rokubacteria bacterium]
MIDPITLEVIREALSSIVREMRVNLVRTAYSSILYEGEDFSCVLMDAEAQIVAMSRGQDHPLHIVPIAWSVKAVREKFGSDIHPGDVFLHNDPYTGGTHLNDVAMIYPLFVEGELFLFPVVRAHWGDVGGMTSGSLSGGASEIYQEGIRIPPVKVYERGRPDPPLLDVLFANMRVARDREGDFRAMVGTCRKAAERVEELLARYGVATLRACIRELLDRAERRMRQRIRDLPDGEYCYEAYLEGGRERLEPLMIRARVAIAGDSATVDLTGSAPQTAGPTNVGPAMAPTGAFTILKAFLDPGGEINSGALRSLTVIAPEGTVVNARLPAPCGGMVEVKYCVESAVMGALAQALAGKVTGDLKGGGNHCYVGGTDPRTGEPFIFYEYPAGGTGAFEGGDGNNAVRTFTESDITSIQPLEAVEQKYPLRVERLELRPDSGGDGRWRGGLGLRREVRVLAQEARLSVLSEKNLLPPYGVCGGMGGAPNRFIVRRDGEELQPSPLPGKVSGFGLRQGDLVVMESSGGGGYGDPLERDPALVARDVAEELVSQTRAAAVYGLALSDGQVDEEDTRRRREQLGRARLRIRLHREDGLEYKEGRRVCRLSQPACRKLGVGAGDIVEFVSLRGAPLRAWVEVDPGDSDGAQLAHDGLAILGVRDGERVEVRRVLSAVSRCEEER